HYHEGKMRCPTHLCTGQEAIAAGVGSALRKDDFVVSSHRSHGHYLAKGGDLNRMMAEIYGKATGCSSGKGGSMHLIDDSVGFMGSTSIIGGTIPVGTGIGLSISFHGTDQISCVFFGDGATEEGVFYESINFAALQKLPVLYICENNLYSVYSPLEVRQPKGRKIFEVVRCLGVQSGSGDGNDAVNVYSKVNDAVKHIRAGNGPYFLEFATYRWREHCGPDFDNNIGYRTEEEYLQWKTRDPISSLETKMLAKQLINSDAIVQMGSTLTKEVVDAFDFAETSPFPSQTEVSIHLFK
ncbi:MAG: thiamine pyrophosphate-dependent dehydrogenase E1 component subunit alpha, partial [Deltaproteobacteria bacterium]